VTNELDNLPLYHRAVLSTLTLIGEGTRLEQERAKHPGVATTWPTEVVLSGEVFAVRYGVNAADELAALLLINETGEVLFLGEFAVTYLTQDDVWAIIADSYPDPAVAKLPKETLRELHTRIVEETARIQQADRAKQERAGWDARLPAGPGNPFGRL
jgi:hypothetical protein